MSSYIVSVGPTAQKTALNRLLAMIEGEDPMVSENLSQPLSTSGNAPYSHWCGGRPADQDRLALYQGLAENLPAPDGGWPLMNGQDVILTEAQAQTAAETLETFARTGPSAEDLPAETIAAMLSALNLKKPAPIDP